MGKVSIEPILISDWPRDDEFGVLQSGSQPKKVLICPLNTSYKFLKPGHRYIFKTSKKQYQLPQMWSEVIASHIGNLTGFKVHQSFVGVDKKTSQCGALIEFFYGYPGEKSPAQFVHGSEYMTRVMSNKEKGRPHAIKPNIKVCRRLKLDINPVIWWASLLAFDSLIGNTDRHTDNWGLLIRRLPQLKRSIYEFAPAYDNATSLGYERADNSLNALGTYNALQAYIDKGTHDCGWDLLEDGPTPHFDLCKRYLDAYPESITAMRTITQFQMEDLSDFIQSCVHLEISIPLTKARADFIISLVEARKERLSTMVGS